MQRLIENFRLYREHFAWQRNEVFSRSAHGQAPLAAMLTCSDSRVLPETILRLDPGELFVIRNAGNMISLDAGQSGELASIEYAVKVLNVGDIVICGHYRCGAVKALVSETPPPNLNLVSNWLKNGHAVLPKLQLIEGIEGKAAQDREDIAVELNVIEQVTRLSQLPFIHERLRAQELRLHAWVLRFETSELLSYVEQEKRFKPIRENPMAYPLFGAKTENALAKPPREMGQSSVLDQTTKANLAYDSSSSGLSVRLRDAAISIKNDVVASIVLFCVSLPFCIAISRASNVSVAAGVTAAIVASWIASAISANRLLVSGPSTSMIAIVAACATSHGVFALALSVVAAGVIQILLGAARIGRLFRATSPALVQGLMAGIGAALLVQQFHLAVDEPPAADSWRNLLTLPLAVVNIFIEHGHDGHRPAAVVGIIAIATMLLWERRKGGSLGWIPPVLVGIFLAALIKFCFSLPIETVRIDSGLIASVPWKSDASSLSYWLTAILPTAVALALAASSESLLTLFSMSDSTKPMPVRPNRELVAQGVGNVASGLLGGLPISIAIVRSQTNRAAGASTYLAVLLHGLWFVIFVGSMPFVLSEVPISALAAVLLVTGFKMMNFSENYRLFREHRDEAIVLLITALSVFSFGILIGFCIGILASLAFLIRVFSRLRIQIIDRSEIGLTDVILEGNANFLRIPKLTDALDALAHRSRVRIDSAALSYLDHACYSLLEKWTEQRTKSGKQTEIDLVTLQQRFLRRIPRPRIT